MKVKKLSDLPVGLQKILQEKANKGEKSISLDVTFDIESIPKMKKCEICGTLYIPVRADQKYHNKSCKIQAYRLRKKVCVD